MVYDISSLQAVDDVSAEIAITGYSVRGRRWIGSVPLWKGKKLVEEEMAEFITDDLLVLKYNKRAFRKLLFQRDNSTCTYCEKQKPWKHLSIDHVVPKSEGGIKSFKNCVSACKTCNGWKGSLDAEYFKTTMEFFRNNDFRCCYCFRKCEYPNLVISVVCGREMVVCKWCDKRRVQIGHERLVREFALKKKVENARKKKIAKQREKWGKG